MMAGDFGLKNDEPVTSQVATELIGSIKPRIAPRGPVNLAEIDRVATSAGFTSREPSAAPPPATELYATPKRKKKAPEPTTPLSMRLRISVHRRFRDWADDRKLSYPEALEKLLDANEVLERLEGQR
jgi:hypothetical protein